MGIKRALRASEAAARRGNRVDYAKKRITLFLVRLHWLPENMARIGRHGLNPDDVEAVFGAEDFGYCESQPLGRWEGEGTVHRRVFRVAFTRPGPDEVYVITAFQTRRRRTK